MIKCPRFAKHFLHTRQVKVGNINHSKGTIAKMKTTISDQVRSAVKLKLATKLNCTGRQRPVQETVNKITHNHITSQMQVCIAPLVNDYELFTPIFIDCSPVKYVEGSYSNLIKLMREKGNSMYDSSQVKGCAADGAYIKANVHSLMNSELDIREDSEWIPFQWDIPHHVDLCDGKAMDVIDPWQTALRNAQLVTKIFTHGKEHQGLIELVDVINIVDENNPPDSDTLDESFKFLNPSLRSSLKFAAHGYKF